MGKVEDVVAEAEGVDGYVIQTRPPASATCCAAFASASTSRPLSAATRASGLDAGCAGPRARSTSATRAKGSASVALTARPPPCAGNNRRPDTRPGRGARAVARGEHRRAGEPGERDALPETGPAAAAEDHQREPGHDDDQRDPEQVGREQRPRPLSPAGGGAGEDPGVVARRRPQRRVEEQRQRPGGEHAEGPQRLPSASARDEVAGEKRSSRRERPRAGCPRPRATAPPTRSSRSGRRVSPSTSSSRSGRPASERAGDIAARRRAAEATRRGRTGRSPRPPESEASGGGQRQRAKPTAAAIACPTTTPRSPPSRWYRPHSAELSAGGNVGPARTRGGRERDDVSSRPRTISPPSGTGQPGVRADHADRRGAGGNRGDGPRAGPLMRAGGRTESPPRPGRPPGTGGPTSERDRRRAGTTEGVDADLQRQIPCSRRLTRRC